MRYIIFITLLFLITGCNEKQEKNQPKTTTQTTMTKSKTVVKNIKLGDIDIKIKNGKLLPLNKKVVILFADNSSYSKEQKEVLKRLHINYYTTNNKTLKKFFKITIYPTIIIINKDKITRYENFTPYEFLKEAF